MYLKAIIGKAASGNQRPTEASNSAVTRSSDVMKYASLFSLIFLLAGTALSADEMRPATFDHPEEKERLGTRIEFPEVSKDMSTMIHCYSQISTRGKMKESGCYQRDNPDMPFLVAILKAAKKATMTPAIINGKARKIYLQFRVEFIAEGESRNIHFYLNPGYAENVEAYGYDHVAAQRVIGKESWQDVCPKRAGYLLLVRAFVGEDGRADNPSIEPIAGIMPTADCQNAIKDTILRSSFAPGFADGVPVPSSYVEQFGN
jgi:hypothetical protein